MTASTKTPFQIVIPRRNSHCCGGGDPFEPDMEYFSVVIAEEDEAQRFDYCAKCWAEVEEKYRADHAQHWKGRIPKKYTSPYSGLNQEERALAILRDMLPPENEEMAEQAFVMALFLAHKRRLVLRADESQLQYEETQSGETFLVPKIDLTELRVDEVRQALADKMRDKPTS